MTIKSWVLLCALSLTMLGCSVEDVQELQGQETAALDTTLVLFPECCHSIDPAVPEAACDGVALSVGRCEEAFGGGACEWTCEGCCMPQHGGVPAGFCEQIEPLGAERCNAVNQGTSCVWTCQ